MYLRFEMFCCWSPKADFGRGVAWILKAFQQEVIKKAFFFYSNDFVEELKANLRFPCQARVPKFASDVAKE